jgi:metal transporter CNNM
MGIAKIAIVLIAQLPLRAAAYPLTYIMQHRPAEPVSGDAEDTSSFWINMSVSVALVLLGGVFAGLTLGLMGQDEVNLQVILQSGEQNERAAAAKVLSLLKRGKHWVLVTLLLSNVITNESLPIVLDRVLGGGWPAVVSSTIAIVIFGEIIPQSASVRYGLKIGAIFAPFVLALMYLMYPIAYPIAILLDYILGEDHGTIYKRAGLKTLVGLHKTMGVERLSEDEVTIISAVLDLKDKPVALVMTPIEDVFTMSSDRILDEETIEEILHTGFNRIPIHVPGEPTNFVGMLLVRTLITYDPEDSFPISSFPLATLPETRPDTSCLNILNYFQEGKSHMVVVSKTPGEPEGALGVLTLEDVIEELIGEEIIDESDVYIDVHKAIKRSNPGPMKRFAMHHSFTPRSSLGFENVYHALVSQDGGSCGSVKPKLNPLNKASNPNKTSNSKVTIKPGQTLSEVGARTSNVNGNGAVNGIDIHQQIAPSPYGSYGTIHRTEQGAVDEALSRNSYDTGEEAAGTGSYFDVQSQGPEKHFYRTGSIIESIINVQGVSKTIIQDTGSQTQSRSSHSSVKSDTASGEYRPLLK